MIYFITAHKVFLNRLVARLFLSCGLCTGNHAFQMSERVGLYFIVMEKSECRVLQEVAKISCSFLGIFSLSTNQSLWNNI